MDTRDGEKPFGDDDEDDEDDWDNEDDFDESDDEMEA